MHRVNGEVSEAEARRRQLQNYQQDAKKHAAKEKEKLEKKKAEKWKRYSHIDMGVKLPDVGQTEDVVRAMQQSAQDDKVMNYVMKLERENARLRAEERKQREESSQAAACSSSSSGINRTKSSGSSVGRGPFEINSVTNSSSSRSWSVCPPGTSARNAPGFEEDSVSVPTVPVPVSSQMNVGGDCATAVDAAEAEKMRQEKFKREMESVRQNMQKLYNQNVKNED